MYYNKSMIKFVDFKKHVAEGKFEAVYALMGEDDFLRRSAVAMLEKIVDMPQLDVACYGDDSDVGEMIADYSQLPMMSRYKLMKCSFENKPYREAERFLQHVQKHPNPAAIVAFDERTLPSCLAGGNVGKYCVVDCARLDKPMVIRWLADKSKRSNASISRDAAELLADYCGNSLMRIDTEFEKLAAVKCGERIEDIDVKAFVAPDGDFKIYELSDALAKKDTDRTYLIYDSLIVNTAPVAIIGALYSHFRRLLYAAISDFDRETLSRYLRVKPYAIDMAARQAKQYSPKRLKRIIDRLSNIDADFKAGRISDRLALDAFIAETLLTA